MPNRVEGQDHPDDRAEQAQQRCHHGNHLNQRDIPRQLRRLPQDRLAELELERFHIHVFVFVVHLKHATQGVVVARRASFLLGVDLGAHGRESNETLERQQYAENAPQDDHRPDITALAVAERQIAFALNQQRQQRSAGGIHGKLHHLAGIGVLQIIRRARVAPGRLSCQLGERAIIDVVLDVFAVGDEIEGTDAHDLGVFALTVELNDGTGEARDLAGFNHFPLQLEPQGFHLIDGGQLARGTHFRGQIAQPLAAIGNLGRDD